MKEILILHPKKKKKLIKLSFSYELFKIFALKLNVNIQKNNSNIKISWIKIFY